MNRGVSLVEVLFSIFVVAIGLLGLAALIPVGQSSLVRAAIEDNKASLGRAAIREIKIRGMLQPAKWQMAVPDPRVSLQLSCFALDPLMSASHGASADTLPAGLVDGLKRITLSDMPGTLARRVFYSSHDLAPERFKDPRGPDSFPFQQGRKSGSNRFQSRPFHGDYSWMATIVREPMDSRWGTYMGSYERPATVSVAVFHKRVLDPNTEWVLDANILGSGEAGGDVELSWRAERAPATAIDRRRTIRPGRWILLFRPTEGASWKHTGYFRWYRIARADDGANPNVRYVTLHGPDWPLTLAGSRAQALVMEGVVGVYEEKMQLEQTSPWHRDRTMAGMH